jgi:hypothetical protein
MKIIFSRKGFDEGNGGVASPIFHDDRICSLPIPMSDRARWNVQYKDIRLGQSDLGGIVTDLTGKQPIRYTGNSRAHVDPDLRKEALVRRLGWLPAFGPADGAQLARNGVGVGDIFLFFGWFRRVKKEVGSQWQFKSGEPNIHVLWGWLQIGSIYHEISNRPKLPLWAYYHPHIYEDGDWRAEDGEFNDTLYVAKKRLQLAGVRAHLPGGGTFKKYHKKLQLTEPGKPRSIWRLPAWMYPSPNKLPLTYHSDKKRWEKVHGKLLLRTVGRGQEFVLDADDYPQAYKWLAELFRTAA